MKICLFDAQPRWSGGAYRVFLTAMELHKRKHDVTVFCLPGSLISRKLADAGISTVIVNPRIDFNIFTMFKILSFLKKKKIELLDIHSPKFYWIAAFAGKFAGSKVIISRNVPYRKKKLKRIINSILYNLADKIISVSERIRNELIEDYKIEPSKVETIYEFIDLREIKGRYNSFASAVKAKTSPSAGIISRLDRNKGLELIAQSIPLAVKKMPGLKFIFSGTGEIEAELKDTIKISGVEKNVEFSGFVEDVFEVISKIDVVILPSPKEAMPRGALESMACEKPVIAPYTSGLAEIIKDNVQGILVEPDNAESMAEGICKIFGTDYKKLGREAFKVIEEKFLLEKNISKYESLCKNL